MVFIGKNGKIFIKPPLTKKGSISSANKLKAIQLIQADVSEPEIVNSGDKHNTDEIKVKQKRSKAIKNNPDKLPAKKRGLPKEEFLEKVRSKLKVNEVKQPDIKLPDIKEPDIKENEPIDILNINPIKKKKKLTKKMRERRANRKMMRNNDINIL
jgi:hypothetical protein